MSTSPTLYLMERVFLMCLAHTLSAHWCAETAVLTPPNHSEIPRTVYTYLGNVTGLQSHVGTTYGHLRVWDGLGLGDPWSTRAHEVGWWDHVWDLLRKQKYMKVLPSKYQVAVVSADLPIVLYSTKFMLHVSTNKKKTQLSPLLPRSKLRSS